uniref:Vacuolar protein sorting-associated protein 35 n=1 Tax=Guillardia theta TaxID=55529 RepID=A0A7S4UC97_GUITH
MVADEMRHLEQYFLEEWKRGRRMVELYELVQHAGNIVPRLFLLITVGSVYIRSKEAPARDILKDLVEMCRGVQHPMRGLFLRNYLLQCARDKLPDIGSEYGSDVADGIDFLMHNFAEMNKLWVRMQHQGPVRDRERRERERLDLRILVGTNLVRLSNLEGIDADMYKTQVLPRILEQVISCKDQIAQQYLMEVIIQVFPDEFHLRTLEEFLATCPQLQSGVDVKAILVALMNRLAAFAKAEPAQIPSDVDMLAIFHSHVSKMTGSNTLELAASLDLQVALVNFALGFAPDRLDFVDQTLAVCAQLLQSNGETRLSGPAKHSTVQLLKTPLISNGQPLTILALPHYAGLMIYLPLESRSEVATLAVRMLLSSKTPVPTPEQVDSLLNFIQPLVKDVEEDGPNELDEEEMETEQNLIAALIHNFKSSDTDTQYAILVGARKHFGQGGPRRIKFTLVPMVVRALELAERVHEEEEGGGERAGTISAKKVFGFTLETIKGLASAEPVMALRLFLQASLIANKCGEDKIAYELVSQAFILYEDEVSDSKIQMELVLEAAGTLFLLNNLDPEDYDTLITNTTKHAARLLKKPDQCRAVYTCSHLFWNAGVKYEDGRTFQDGKRVLDCLQRSLKIADVCMQSSNNVNLFIEILDRYLYYYEAGNEKVTVKYIQGLLDLVNEHLSTMEAGQELDNLRGHYNATLAHIRRKKEGGDERFSELTV